MNKNMITLDLMLPDFKNVSDDQKKLAIQEFFIQIQGVMIGAVVCLPSNHDFKLKINNKEIIDQIQLPEVLLKKISSNKNLVSIVDIVSGDGKIFQ